LDRAQKVAAKAAAGDRRARARTEWPYAGERQAQGENRCVRSTQVRSLKIPPFGCCSGSSRLFDSRAVAVEPGRAPLFARRLEPAPGQMHRERVFPPACRQWPRLPVDPYTRPQHTSQAFPKRSESVLNEVIARECAGAAANRQHASMFAAPTIEAPVAAVPATARPVRSCPCAVTPTSPTSSSCRSAWDDPGRGGMIRVCVAGCARARSAGHYSSPALRQNVDGGSSSGGSGGGFHNGGEPSSVESERQSRTTRQSPHPSGKPAHPA